MTHIKLHGNKQNRPSIQICEPGLPIAKRRQWAGLNGEPLLESLISMITGHGVVCSWPSLQGPLCSRERLACAPPPQLIIEYSLCSRPYTTCWRQSREPERWSPVRLAAFPPGIRADRQKASYCLITAVISARKKSVVGKESTLTGEAGQAVICLPQQAVGKCLWM